MWLFTTIGFFSLTRSVEEPDKMQFRARVPEDLEALQSVAGIGERIIETPEADYRWRIVVDPEVAQAAVGILVGMITYSNFKAEVHRNPDQDHKSDALLTVWGAMREVQDQRVAELAAEMTDKEYDQQRRESWQGNDGDEEPTLPKVLSNPRAKRPKGAGK